VPQRYKDTTLLLLHIQISGLLGKKAKETSLKHKTQNDCACGFCLFLCVSLCDLKERGGGRERECLCV